MTEKYGNDERRSGWPSQPGESSRVLQRAPSLEFAPKLVEEGVFLAMHRAEVANPALARSWSLERELIYALPVGPKRDRAFRELDASWFRELRLDEPLVSALRKCPAAGRRLAAIHVRAAGARDMGSELYSSPALHGAGGEGPLMVLAFPPSAFLKPDSLRDFVLRELLHVADMLDPGFGYQPSLPDALAEDRPRAELVRDRFRVLWEARVAGLLARASDPLATLPSMPEHFRRAFGASASLTKLAELYADAWSGTLATQPQMLACAQTALAFERVSSF